MLIQINLFLFSILSQKLLAARASFVVLGIVQCPLLAQSGHSGAADQLPLSGANRTSTFETVMSVNDPKRT